MEQMVIKKGVEIKYLTPPMLEIMKAVFEVWNYPGVIPVLTSSFDGQHMNGSYHYAGLALDFRTNSISPLDREDFAKKLQEELGDDFDVVLENSHLHVEFDPEENPSETK